MSAELVGRVSVIIPARNEEANIERVVRSVERQEGVREIIVVDDESTDRTGEIVQRLATEMPHLRSLRIESLPEGWTGKANAATAGARAAVGEWLLFTDADTEHLAGSLAGLLERAEGAGDDLLSISPGQETPTWWEKSVIPRVFVQLARWYPFEEVSRPGSARAAANGQYLLIRRAAYERAGGFESVRDKVLEDVALAERVKATGGGILFLPGAEWVRTRMYRRFGEMWQGWTKNLFPLAGEDSARLARAVAGCLAEFLPVTAFLALCSWVAAGRGSSAVIAAALGCFFVALMCQWSYARELGRLGYDRGLENYQAAGSALLGLLLVNSWRAHRVRKSIEWKGRRYPAARRKDL